MKVNNIKLKILCLFPISSFMLTRKTDTNIYFNSVIYRALTVGLFMEIGIIFTAMFIVYIGYKVIYKKK